MGREEKEGTENRVRMASHQHRILLYTTCYNVLDGVTLTIRKIEQEILAAGHHVFVLTTESGNPSNTHLDGEHPNRSVHFLDNSIPIPFLNDPNNAELSYHLGFSLSANIKQKIMDFEPSLIHVTVPDCTCLHLIQYARDKELPLMGTFHSNIPEYMEHYPGLAWLKHVLAGFFRHQYNFLQALYVPTPYIHKHLREAYKLDKITNLGIWGRGIDLDTFTPDNRSIKFRTKLGIQQDEVVICWVGRIVPEKRPDIFAHVIKRLHREGVRFRAIVVGAGPNEEELMGLPNTKYLGWLGGDTLRTAYASSDIFLFPSAVETFGNVTLEAAASGLPLIVEAGCSGHLVNTGINGYGCVGDDLDTWYNGTFNLVTDHELRRRFARASRELSLNFEKRKVVQQMLENYSTVTDEFYTKFGGQHCNRDLAYINEDSFVGGNHPRPMVLQAFEVLFVILFQILWYSASAVFWLHGTMMSRFMAMPPPALPVPVEKKLKTNVQKDTHDQPAIQENTPPDAMESSQVTPLPRDSSDQQLPETTSTSCRLPPLSIIGDCRLSQNLAILLTRMLMLQFRIESIFRNTFGACCSPQKWREMKRKRKNSSAGNFLIANSESITSDEITGLIGRGEEELGRRVRSQPICGSVETVEAV